MFLKKRQYKPLYKKFLKVQKNVQNKKKLLKFKRQKWKKFINYIEYDWKWKRKKPYTINDFYIPKFSGLGNAFRRKFKNDLNDRLKFKLFYMGLKRRFIKKKINAIFYQKSKNFDLIFLELFESRLDSVLYRSYFSSSFRNAQQMISHGYIKVNKRIIKKKSYLLKQGDLIEIDPKYSKVVKNNIKKLRKYKPWFWPIPHNYLIIKYKTLQIIIGDIKYFNFSNSFFFLLNTNSILTYYQKH